MRAVFLVTVAVMGVSVAAGSGPPQTVVVNGQQVVTGMRQGPARDLQTRKIPVGTALLAGAIVDASTGQPLARARVTLSGTDVGMGRALLTDDSGAFSFEALPAGHYLLGATRPRYLQASYGQTRPDGSGTPIAIEDGQQIKDLRLALSRGAVITGVVVDDHGEPATGAQVRAMRYMNRNGARQLVMAHGASTDDRGVYRLFDLTPGDYYVSAVLNSSELRMEANAQAEAAAIQQALASAKGHTETMTMSTGATVAAIAAPVITNEPTSTYVPTYYPGTVSAGTATVVTVGPAAERAGVDIQVQRVKASSIRGIIIGPTAALPPNVNVTLTANDSDEPNPSLPFARRLPDGTFEAQDVPPGEYTLIARTNPSAVSMVNGEMVVTKSQPLWGRAEVVVPPDGTPVTGIVITLQPGRSLTGHVIYDGTAPHPGVGAPSGPSRVMAMLSPAPGADRVPGPMAQVNVDANGDFIIKDVMPGRYLLRVTGAPRWYLRSAVVNGQDTLDVPVEITGDRDITDAVVTLVDRTSDLSGTLTDATGRPRSDLTVVVFPQDQQFWTPGSRRVRTARPATDGRYQLRDLPPGDYLIAAVSDVDPSGASDPQFLQMLLPAALPFTLHDGEKRTQDLRVATNR